MNDYSKRADDDAARKAKALEQIYGLRGWLTAFLAQTLQAEAAIKYRIAGLEHEAQALRAQLDLTTPGIESLRRAIQSVDETIRRRRGEIQASVAAPSDDAKTEREGPVEGSEQRRRSGRRRGG
jgi:hypothetical protein